MPKPGINADMFSLNIKGQNLMTAFVRSGCAGAGLVSSFIRSKPRFFLRRSLSVKLKIRIFGETFNKYNRINVLLSYNSFTPIRRRFDDAQ